LDPKSRKVPNTQAGLNTQEGQGRRLNLNLEPITGALIFVLLLLGSLARGLFFQADLIQFQLAIAVVFGLEWLDRMARRDGRLIDGWADALPLLLGLSYCASFLVAVDKRVALGEALKYLTLFMVYWIVSRLSYSRVWALRFANLVVFIGVVVSAIGLGAAVRLVQFPGAFVGGDILSTFQYPNALAGFLSATCVIVIALWGPRAKDARGQRRPGAADQDGPEVSWIAEIWYAFSFVLCAIVLLSTRSRGAWALMPLAGALALWGLPPGFRFQAGLRTSFGVVATLVILKRVERAIASVTKASAGAAGAAASAGARAAITICAWIGIATLAVVLAIAIIRMLSRTLSGTTASPQTQMIARYALSVWAVGVVLWYAVYAGYAYPTAARGFLTPGVAVQVESIDAGNQSLIARQVFWGDAVRIMRDRPLLGAGGGGWNALYHMYQKKLYSSALVHSHPLEIGVETGVPGFLIYLGMWAVLIGHAVHLWRRRRLGEIRGEEDACAETAWMAAWPAFTGAVALGLHSCVDFDFSLTAIAACAWGLMACANGVFRSASQGAPNGVVEAGGARGNRIRFDPVAGPTVTIRSALGQGVAGLLLCTIVFVPSARLSEASERGAAGARAMLSGDYVAAEKSYREAIGLDPYTASYWIDLAQLSIASYTVDAQPWRLDQVRDYCRRAVAVQRSNLPARIRAVELLASIGDLDEALDSSIETAKWIPRDVRVYEGIAEVYSTLAARALDKGDIAAGREYAASCRQIIPAAAEALNPDPGPRLAESLRGSAETPAMCYAVGKTSYMLGDYAEATRLLEKSVEIATIRADAQVWLGLSYEIAGDAPRAKRVLDSARATLGGDVFNARYSQLKRLGGGLR